MIKIPYKTFVFDMDGTLLDAHNEITPLLLSKLKALKAQHYKLIIATGRTFGEVQKIVKEPLFDAYICSNAMTIYNAQRELIQQRTLPPALLPAVLQLASTHRIYYELRQPLGEGYAYAEDIPYMEKMIIQKQYTTVSEHELNSRKEAVTRLQIISEAAFQNTIKVYFFHYDQHVLAHFRQMLTQLVSHYAINIESSSVNSCEIVDIAATKAAGLQFLVAQQLIKQEDIVCFGDSFNDLSMFHYSAYCVAMKNANAALKEIANDITTFRNDENGVYEWLVKHVDS